MKKIKIPFFSNYIEKRANEYAKLFLSGEVIPEQRGTMTVSKSLQLSTFWDCVRTISEDISSLPVDIFKISGKNERDFSVNNPLFNMLKNVCNKDYMLTTTLFESLIVNLLLWGNCYCQIVRNKLDEIIELYPLLSKNMTINRKKNGQIKYIYKTDDGKERIFNQDQIINIPLFSENGIVGMSIIKYANNCLELTDNAEQFGRNFFLNGTRLSGTIEMEPGTKLKDKAKTLEEWSKSYSGNNNVGKVAILEGGMKYKQIGIPPEDAQFLETRQFQLTEICRWFRMPPHKIGDLTRATFSNIEQQNIDYLSTLNPIIRKLEKSFSFQLLNDFSEFIKFDTDILLRGDFESRMKGYSIAVQNGIMKPNEVRERENLNSNKSGDVLICNGNMITLENAKKQIPKSNNSNISSKGGD